MYPTLDAAGRRALEAAYDWVSFDRELTFRTLAPFAVRVGHSGFRAILQALDLPRGCRALDVGAGGFVGATTTRHLVDILDARIDAVEINPELADKLRAAFGDRIRVIAADIFEFDPGPEPYDLVVLDLPVMDLQINRIVPDYVDRLAPGGYFVCCVVYDLAQVFDSREPLLDPSRRDEFESFLRQRFGALRLDPVTVQRAFFGTPLTCRGLVDKWLSRSGNRGFGWVVLQKDGQPAKPRRFSAQQRVVRALSRLLDR